MIELIERDMRSDTAQSGIMAQELVDEGISALISPCDVDPSIAAGMVTQAAIFLRLAHVRLRRHCRRQLVHTCSRIIQQTISKRLLLLAMLRIWVTRLPMCCCHLTLLTPKDCLSISLWRWMLKEVKY